MGYLRAACEPGFEALPSLGIVVMIAVGAWRVSRGAVTAGTLVQFISLFQLLAFPMRLIGFLLSDLPRAVVGWDRLQGVFDEPVTLRPADGGLTPPPAPLGLEVRTVSFGYGGEPVLRDLSFQVRPNESVALGRQTGSGKSTVAHLLVRLADPDLGAIRLGGVDLRQLAGDARP